MFEYPSNFTSGNETIAVEGMGSLLLYASYATGGWFASGILVLIFLLVFTITGLVDIRKSVASASFVTFIFSIYFARLAMINTTIPFILVGITIIGFFMARSGTQSGY